jgi:hypothetical protein
MPNERRTYVHCEATQECAPGITHGHAGKLPYEEHDPMVDAGSLIVPENDSTHALELDFWEGCVEFVLARQIIEDGLSLYGTDHSPD